MGTESDTFDILGIAVLAVVVCATHCLVGKNRKKRKEILKPPSGATVTIHGMGDPTPAEIQGFNTFTDVFTWVGLPHDSIDDQNTTEGSLAAVLGIRAAMHPRTLGWTPAPDYEAVIQTWQIATPGPNAGDPPTRQPPTLAQLGMARLLGRCCRLVVGAKPAPAPATPVTAPAAPVSAAATRRIKLNAVLSQVNESEIGIMSEADMVTGYMLYATVYGGNERPPKKSEPSVEQVSVLKHLIDGGSTPYVDFSVWGPYMHRLVKKIKLSGYSLGRDGKLQLVELAGPSNYDMWLSSFQVYTNAMLMLDQADLGVMLKYRERIEKIHQRYGERIWALLYQADVRCRLEAFERIRRQIATEQEMLRKEHVANGGTGDPPKVPGCDPARPWNLVFQRAVQDDAFWREEVVEPGVMVLTKISGLNEQVTGDAPIKGEAASSSTGPQQLLQQVQPPPAALGETKIRPRKDSRGGRHHQVENGKYVVNRTGHPLCDEFNTGQCSTGNNGWCGVQWNKVHQCNRCLGSHPAAKCPHDAMPQPKIS